MDQLQGTYTSLAEYTSREARYNLVLACLDELNRQAATTHVSATRALSDLLYVSQRTIQRWARGGIQSCNVNAEAIIEAAITLAPEKATEILLTDLEKHRRELWLTLPSEARRQIDDTPLTPREPLGEEAKLGSDTLATLPLSLAVGETEALAEEMDPEERCPECGAILVNPNYCNSCGANIRLPVEVTA